MEKKILHWQRVYADEGYSGVGKMEITVNRRFETKDKLAKWGRNSRKFTQKKQLSSTIVGHIIQDTHGRGSRYPKLATRLHALNMHVSVKGS
ncbi:hypothetical protein H5410_036881 [Solanum commersonii]|uniref:Uncharacterized protein n=1 Tax=Solanum commersonii TaxID=4109 RepID=A0A9J5Y5J4_SOLCO|nr:hypothetical protein H5410_036881 [Solanum commersonii]